MKYLFLLYLIFLRTSFADPGAVRVSTAKVISDGNSVEEYCSSANSNLINRFSLPGRPGYFVKPIHLDNKLYFSLVINGLPALFDPETGKAKTISGAVDPVASFDDKIMTVLDGPGEKRKVRFLDPNHLELGKEKEIAASTGIFGAYQAMAPIESGNGKQSYRLLLDEFDQDRKTDRSYPAIKDFIFEKGKLSETSKGFLYPCEGKNLQTPYLSKDGKKLVALNVDTQTTQVFDLVDGKCNFNAEVPYRTAKADFSYDNSKIVFHVAEVPNADRRGWVDQMRDSDVSNIYVFDIKTGKTEKITSNQKANSYYPTFLPDGTIAHIDMIQTDDPYRPKYAIGISKTSLSAGKSEISVCEPQSENKKSLFAIGQILSGICNDDNMLPKIHEEAVILKTIGLSGKDCRDLINRFWSTSNVNKLAKGTEWTKIKSITKSEFTSLKSTDLVAACPDDSTSTSPSETGRIDLRFIPQSCSSCHGSALPLDNLKGLNALQATGKPGSSLKDEVIRRLKLPTSDPQHMPPSSYPQSATDRLIIEQYLKQIDSK